MLILTRKPGESLYIGDTIKITIVEIKGHQIRVGIDAPTDLRIYREEIYVQILEENRKAAEGTMDQGGSIEGLQWKGKAPTAGSPPRRGLGGLTASKVTPPPGGSGVSSAATPGQGLVVRRKRKKLPGEADGEGDGED